MKAIRTILVGLDLQPDGSSLTRGSRRAFQQALWLATSSRARLVLVHSTATDEAWGLLTAFAYVVSQGVSAAGTAAMQALVTECREQGIEAELVVTGKRPWIAITQLAISRGASLVVVGKRSEDDGDGRLLGTVSTKLLRKCPSAVWVVKVEAPARLRQIVAASDLTAVGAAAILHGAFLAELSQADLVVVHAWQLSMSLIHEKGLVDDAMHAHHIEERRQAALAGLREQLRPTGWEQRATLDVQCTTPARVIMDAVARVHADLVVMGTISRGGLPGLLVGNTAERLLPRLDCSILTVKPDNFVSPISPDDDETPAG